MRGFILILLGLLTMGSSANAQDCVDVEYWSSGTISTYLEFPFTSTTSGNTYSKVGFYIDPVADGDLSALRAQFYNNNVPTPYDGTLRVWACADTSGSPAAVLSGPLDFPTAGFNATYGAWDEVDLSPMGHSFLAGVPFHVVWEFIPASDGNALNPIAVSGAEFGSQMYNETLDAWAWWFTDVGDLVQEVEVCYSETPPGNFVLSSNFIDMGRVEAGGSLSEELLAYNNGGMNTTLTSITVTNPAFFSALAGPALPYSFAPGDSVALSVFFTPGATSIFRDTTSVVFNWSSDGGSNQTEFFTIAGSSDGVLTNEWSGAPDEPDWFVNAPGDTSIYGGTWQLFAGSFNRTGTIAGHGYTAETDTAAAELYTFVDNPTLDEFTLQYAHTQNYPGDTFLHALFVYGIEEDSLEFLYGFDVTDLQQQSPTWAHVSAELDSLPDSLAVSFYYEGSFADSWFIDDVEFLQGCGEIVLDAQALSSAQVSLTWMPFAGGVVRIMQSEDAYDFSMAVEVDSVPSEAGSYQLSAIAGQARFFHAVRECDPELNAGMARIDQHPRGTSKIAVSDLSRVVVPSRSAQPLLPIAPATRLDATVR